MRSMALAACLLLGTSVAVAEVSVGIRLPGVSIGINMPRYPDLVAIPGYPVYYAPGLDSNFFFYDGLYWVYADDRWYASSWYNGPWDVMGPDSVPYFVLRVPIRYYRSPPAYFRGWASDSPPRWGDHWGHEWEQRRQGWDRWNRATVHAAAPLPSYQREYSGDRYPGSDQQRSLRDRNYNYTPHEPVVQHMYYKAPARHASVPTAAQRAQRDARSTTPTNAPRGDTPSAAERQDSRRHQDQHGEPQPPRSDAQRTGRQDKKGDAQTDRDH